jgi:hemolysin D
MAENDTIRKAAQAGDLHPDAVEVDSRMPPRLTRMTLYVLLAFIVIAIAWAALSTVDIIVTAQGRLITTAQSVVVQALETSVVRSLDVRVGQSVHKGDRLVTLDPVFAEADVAQTKQRYESLESEVARLEAELDGKPYRINPEHHDSKVQAEIYEKRAGEYQARDKSLRAEVARLEADLAGTKRSLVVLEERLTGLKKIEKMKSDLQEKKFFSEMGLLEAREKRLEVENAYEELSNRAKQLVEQASKARAELDVFIKSWRQKTLDDTVRARRERDTLKEQLNKAERRGQLVYLTAPLDSVVLEINKRTVGSVAKEADPILTLVPQGVALEAELQIPAEDIGFVRVNDPVKLKIDAFPFQKHGVIAGRLTVVGGDSVAVDPSSAAARGTTRAYYPARVADMNNTLKQVPKDTQLVPGMTLTAEIKVSERSVISYFLYPLTKAFGESIREP